MIVLSKLTGWGLAEILDMDMDDFLAWHKAAQEVENDIAQQVKAVQ